MNSSNIYDNEASIIKWSAYAKNLIIHTGKKVSPKDFLFIDLSHEKAIIEDSEDNGVEVITDRKKLADFLSIVKENQHNIKYILCDVFLKGKSKDDSLLQHSIKGVRNLIFAASQDINGKIKKVPFSLNQGITDYEMSGGQFIKLNLFQNNKTPTLPVEMYSYLTGKKFSSSYPFNLDDGRLCFNYMIVDYKIKSNELCSDCKYKMARLSGIMALPNEKLIAEMLKNKILVLGDFENDVHDTVFGSAPGSLILLNVYLSMLDGKHLVSFWWLFYLIIVYTIYSRIMLFHTSNYKKKQISFLGPLIKSAFFLSLSSVISYLLFDHHLQVAFLTLYISVLIFIIQIYKRPKHWKYYFGKKFKELKKNILHL